MTQPIASNDDRDCPIYGKHIGLGLCLQTMWCIDGIFQPSSVPELDALPLPIELARIICKKCPYNDSYHKKKRESTTALK